MVTETIIRKSGIEEKDVENSIGLEKMSIVGEDQLLPIFVQKDQNEQVKCTNSDNSNSNYLHSLLELYKDQVNHLKKELNRKNDVIKDLIQIVKERHNNNATVAIDNDMFKSVAKFDMEDNKLDMEHNTPEVLSDRGCSKTNEYEGLWNYPKRLARLLAKSADIATPIVDQN